MPIILLLTMAGALLMAASRAKAPTANGQTVATSSPQSAAKTALDDVVNSILGPIAGLPRGIRANNPLNIREAANGGDQWQGESAENTDSAFEEFDAPEYGYRAAAKIVASYQRRGLQTLSEIIGAWAPESENNTAAYLKTVSDKTGLPPYWPVAKQDLPVIFQAMAIVENGAKWATHPSLNIDVIKKGVALA
ncbi:hypothetical protein [Zhongshania sp. BJYM1]|uniref:hypothetical protein n=1 Tax=Zhongshania aquatica TaxID=2965069 RepID=UPI0022B4BE3F|nr:hypothetical protein [Marortus sp. BJYM1]